MSENLQISIRGIEMPQPPIRILATLAYKAESKGLKMYHLNIVQPALPTPKKALDYLKDIDRTSLEYTFTRVTVASGGSCRPLRPLSDQAYSDIAREYLLAEGLRPDRVIKTGSPMYEVLHQYLPKVEKSAILETLGLVKGEYFVVSAHREENIASEKNFFNLVEVLNTVAAKFGFPVIVSCHPRTRKMIEKHNVQFHEQVRLMKPMGLSDYLALQVNSKTVLSDRGTISEESSILNFRALNIREAHERPEAMEEASVMMVGLNPERVMQGLVQLQYQKIGCERNFRPVDDYSMPNVSDKVVRIILSYTDYIKRVVWSE